jgi:hypothetical protein
MRHSEMCKGDLNCSQGMCTCTAARVITPHTGGTRVPPQNLGGTIQRRGVEGEQQDPGMANPSGTSPETK